MKLHFICAKSGNGRSVFVYHTNKNLGNFYSLDRISDLFYSGHWVPGEYLFHAGAQNGYYEKGYTYVMIIAQSSNGRTPDSDSGYCGSNPC